MEEEYTGDIIRMDRLIEFFQPIVKVGTIPVKLH